MALSKPSTFSILHSSCCSPSFDESEAKPTGIKHPLPLFYNYFSSGYYPFGVGSDLEDLMPGMSKEFEIMKKTTLNSRELGLS